MLRLLVTSLICLTVASSNVSATILSGSVVLKKGDASPYDGILLTEDKATTIYYELLDYDKLKLEDTSLRQAITLLQENNDTYLKEVTELKDQNTTLDTALTKANSNSFWSDALWFVIGAAVAGAAVAVAERH